jgi:hypothetical protein
MIRIFKRRRPEPTTHTASTSDRLTAALHGKTPEQWDALPALVKADLRENIVHADRFKP